MTLDREAIIERIDPRSSERDLLNLLLDVAEAVEALRAAIPSAWNDLMVNLSQRKVVDKALDRLEAAIKGAVFCRRCDDGDTDRICTCGRAAIKGES